jgi:hypothetical protein
MRIALALVLAGLSWMVPQGGLAQGPGPSVLWERPSGPVAALAVVPEIEAARAPDHRWEGMAVGAGVGALAFGFLGAVVCGASESKDCNMTAVLGVGLLGAFCGGIIGGVIGGAIPKEEPADSTDEVIEWGS